MTQTGQSYFASYQFRDALGALDLSTAGIKTATRLVFSRPVEVFGAFFEGAAGAQTASARVVRLDSTVSAVAEETGPTFSLAPLASSVNDWGFAEFDPIVVNPGKSVAFETVATDASYTPIVGLIVRAFPFQTKANERTQYTAGPYTSGPKNKTVGIPATDVLLTPLSALEEVVAT